jgi:hypothetical protein
MDNWIEDWLMIDLNSIYSVRLMQLQIIKQRST